MTFFDRLKSVTEQAATRARIELETLQKRRELSQAYADLGQKAFELTESGEVSHATLSEGAERIRRLKGELEELAAAERSASE